VVKLSISRWNSTSMTDQKIYLEDVPLNEAIATFNQALRQAELWHPLSSEVLDTSEANGRVTSEPVWARVSAPHFNASAMDGFAIRSQDTTGATETNPILLTLAESGGIESEADRPATAVDTGQPMPVWADAVVMIEHTQRLVDDLGRRCIEIRASLPPWRNVRQMGEDMVATELVVPAFHRLWPVDLGALAGSGNNVVSVFRKPRVAILPTGSELVSVDDAAEKGLSLGQIIEYNSIVLASQIIQWGGLPTRWPIIADDFDSIREAVVEAAAEHDLILINAGSSAGRKDFTAEVVSSLGTLLVHGIAVRPGHPVILGMIGTRDLGPDKTSRNATGAETDKRFLGQPDAGDTFDEVSGSDNNPGLDHDDRSWISESTTPTPVIGVPGYPVSAALTGEIFVEPLVSRWQGKAPHRSPTLQAIVTRKITSKTGDDDFVRVTVGKVGARYTATPISRGAGVITSLVRADGIVRIPRFSEGLDAGATVDVDLYRTPAEIEQTIVAIGSHDLSLDLLSQFLAEEHQGKRLSSANVGSLGGLIALRRGEAHLAGSHLLDPETGEYNESYVKRYLPGQSIVLVSLVGREQGWKGWIIPKGNPLHLTGWDDAGSPGLRMINRQRGAGTRILLDYELEQRGILSENISGYENDAYNHLAVAAAVASGIADVGLGIPAAARALDLDFVPLASEKYELVIPREFYESEHLKPLLDILAVASFRKAVEAMPGYDVRSMGDVRTVGDGSSGE
jgi:putative molybdopterin biosynthesis protein